MRARRPDREDYVVRDGVRLSLEVYDNEGPTVLLMPTWSISHSRHWKAQIPYLARHFRVVTFDGRGNGCSDRPTDASAYADTEYIADAVAVLDATDTERAVVAGVSMGAHWTALVAGLHPERVAGAVLIGVFTPLVPKSHPDRESSPFEQDLEVFEGWNKYNMHYWRRAYTDFAQFFFSQVFSEPHSTKQQEDAVAWAEETDPEVLIASHLGPPIVGDELRAAIASIRCPVLVIHGTDDHIRHRAAAEVMAEATGGDLLLVEGGGHFSQARDPVLINLAMRRFVERATRPVPA